MTFVKILEAVPACVLDRLSSHHRCANVLLTQHIAMMRQMLVCGLELSMGSFEQYRQNLVMVTAAEAADIHSINAVQGVHALNALSATVACVKMWATQLPLQAHDLSASNTEVLSSPDARRPSSDSFFYFQWFSINDILGNFMSAESVTPEMFRNLDRLIEIFSELSSSVVPCARMIHVRNGFTISDVCSRISCVTAMLDMIPALCETSAAMAEHSPSRNGTKSEAHTTSNAAIMYTVRRQAVLRLFSVVMSVLDTMLSNQFGGLLQWRETVDQENPSNTEQFSSVIIQHFQSLICKIGHASIVSPVAKNSLVEGSASCTNGEGEEYSNAVTDILVPFQIALVEATVSFAESHAVMVCLTLNFTYSLSYLF